MRALIWFRSDLRVCDNTALHHACHDADQGVVAVFAVTPQQWLEHHWGGMKVDFVLRNLSVLSAELDALNIALCIVRAERFEDVARPLRALAQEHACDRLYFNAEHEVNELHRDRDVAEAFEADGRSVHVFADQTIADVAQLRTGAGDWYQVFTPFKRKWCAVVRQKGVPAAWPAPRRQAGLGIAPDAVPAALDDFGGLRRPDLWPAGTMAAQTRLERFADQRIGKYDTDRDVPATEGTSTLSPYLAAGVISPRQCLRAALEVNRGRLDSGNQGATTWISELIWREFYRYILMGFPRVCRNQPFRRETAALRWRNDEAQFTAWCNGATGFPLVDAGMRQLNATGWMHNRLRMVTAMFLTKDLFIDWRWGEQYFMQCLVDADFANNNGGWQWSASTGTDAAPYFRIFNPFSQGKRYDPEGRFIQRWVPELAEVGADRLHRPEKLHPPEKRRRPGKSLHAADRAVDIGDYPRPIVDRSRTREAVVAAFKQLPRRSS